MSLYLKKINNLFYYWLVISFALVFLMILIGGLTRLTNSGLSITEWELFRGILPPLNQETWNKYFLLYQNIPQYKLINSSMTLDQFKIIFYWEYFHRILGRIIGLFFMIPLLYFHFKGIINKKNILTCYLILSLIILQGFVGWYMVESGLINNTTVSHYRLSVHLSIAFLIISIIFWVILNLKNNTHNYFFIKKKYNYFFYLLFILMSFQIIMGAFVSGLDAGKIYQTWPMMNYTYFPNDSIFNSLKDYLDFNNHGLVQFYHRNIAYLIFLLILTGGFVIFKKKFVRLYKSFCLLFLILLLQIFLGIFTLITGLNINMASAHQICGLLLILTTINLYYDYTN